MIVLNGLSAKFKPEITIAYKAQFRRKQVVS